MVLPLLGGEGRGEGERFYKFVSPTAVNSLVNVCATFNIQHRTFNFQGSFFTRIRKIERWALNVGCWMFPQKGRQGPAADHFRGSGLRASRRCERWEPWRSMASITPPRRNTAALMANPWPPGPVCLHCFRFPHPRQNLLHLPSPPQLPWPLHATHWKTARARSRPELRSANLFDRRHLL
jgi:hypothetical protein